MRARHVAAAVLLVAIAGPVVVADQQPGVRHVPVFPRIVIPSLNASNNSTPALPTSRHSDSLIGILPSSIPPGSAAPWTTALTTAPSPGQSDSISVPVDFLTLHSNVTATPRRPGAATSATSTTINCVTPATEGHTVISVVYPSTITFYGNPTDYVPPHPEMTTPELCAMPTDTDKSESGPDVGPVVSGILCQHSGPGKNCDALSVGPPTTSTRPRSKEVIVTFVTTDKNPSVVFSPVATPDFGKDPKDQADQFPNHTADPPRRPQTRFNAPHEAVTASVPHQTVPPPTFIITAAPTQVIINRQTFTVQPGETTKVTVEGRTFTINPGQIIGDGSTIQRPGHGKAGHVTPSTTVVGDVSVVLAPSGQHSLAVIDGTTVAAPSGTAVVAGSHSIIVLPGAEGLVLPGLTTIRLATEQQPMLTEVFVEGGQMITAIGPTLAVIDGTTLPFGQDIPAIERTVGGEVVTIGPSGVVVGSKTIGGPGAAQQDTEIKIVGGATLTQIGESVLVVGDATFTVGPGGDGPLTTEVGGENITIGPKGVFFTTISLPYPFGPTIVTSIVASPSATVSTLPRETDRDDASMDEGEGTDDTNKKENDAWALEAPISIVMFCVAIGFWS
jgi:hypothetical protein